MTEAVGEGMDVSAVWATVNTLGFWTGVAFAGFLALVALVLLFWCWMKRRNQYLTISVQEGSEFKISLRAVRTHLSSYIAKAYPRLHLQAVRLRGCRGGLKAEVDVKALCGEDMQSLSNMVMKDLQDSLNRTMGLGELFTRVDVVVCSLEMEEEVTPREVASAGQGASSPRGTETGDDGALPPLASDGADK